MKKTLTVLTSILMLVACNSQQEPTQAEKAEIEAVQQTPKDTKTENKTEPAASTKQEQAEHQHSNSAHQHAGSDGQHSHGDHQHNHAAAAPNLKLYQDVEPKDSCEKPIVMEFFAYQCPHCYSLEPEVKKWLATKSDDVEFITIPTDLGQEQYVPFLMTHYAADKLGILDKIKPMLFKMVHEDKKLIQGVDVAIELLVSAGVTKELAETTIKDQEFLKSVFTKNITLMQNYRVSSVPTILVNYQYKTDVPTVNGRENLFPTVDRLLSFEAKCKNNK